MIDVAATTLRSGDARESALEALTGPQLDEAFRLAAVVLRDESEAEDVVQDAAIVALRKIGSLRESDRFGAWFGRIVLNLCRDRLRGRRRDRVRDATLSEDLARRAPDGYGTVLRRAAIEAAFPALEPDLQIVVVLRFYRDLQLDEIAELLGIPLGTVKSRLHTAMRRLRAEMERGGWHEEEA